MRYFFNTPCNHPVKLRLPPLHRRGINWCKHDATTPSSFACHPSTGGELTGANMMQPPRQASPPGAGAMQSPQCICTRHLPSTGGELTGANMMQPPRQASPPGAGAMQSPQCICTRQFPSTGGELTAPAHVGCSHCLNRLRHLYNAFVLNKSTIIYSDDA